jgi:cobalt-zinc-cadmium resistance protein CzcA
MNKIIEFSVKNKNFVFIVTAILIVLGVHSFQSLPVDAVPDITNVQVQVNTKVKGLVPEEIEKMITFPIESQLNGLPGVESVRSITKYGISQVTVIFEDGRDIYLARQLVNEKLMQVDLPPYAKPRLGPISTGLGEIVHYTIDYKNPSTDAKQRLHQFMQLRALQEWDIKPRLLSIKGVNDVDTLGGHEKQFFIKPDLLKMFQFGIGPFDIQHAIESTNYNIGGGYITQGTDQVLIRGIGLLKNIQDIENVIIKRLNSFDVIQVKDVATVGFDTQLRNGSATVNGREAVVATIFMLKDENSRVVAQRVTETIEQIKKDLPEWATMKVLYSRSDMVSKTLNTVQHNIVLGAILVIAFLLMLVGNIRAAIITALTIPISLLMTFILMKYNNVSGNLMSLGALDFGIIIDGSVIVIENCVHQVEKMRKKLNRALTKNELQQIVIEATTSIRKAAGFGELVVIVVFVPIFALTGVEGKMFTPMATTFIFALISALILSFTLMPALASTFLSLKTSVKKPLLMQYLEQLFRPSLRQALKIKKTVGLVALSLLLMSAFMFTKLGAEFIPQLNEGDFSIQFMRDSGISLEASIDLQERSEKLVSKFPQVKNIFSKIGASEMDPMGVDTADTYVMLKPIEQWPKDSNIQDKSSLIQAVKESLITIQDQEFLFSQPVQLRFNELLEGTKSDISIKIFGSDLNILMNKAKEITHLLKQKFPESEVEPEVNGNVKLLEYQPKLDKLHSLGVSAMPVLDTVHTAIGGKTINYLYEGVNKYPIVIRLSQEDRNNMERLRSLPVRIRENFTVPISEVADITQKETFVDIKRELSKRRVAILVNPNTRDIEDFVQQAEALVRTHIDLPDGYYLKWGGSFENLQSAKKRLMILVPLALATILFMLYAAFKNASQVLLIFSCFPMALIGGVVSLLIMDIPFSISAGVGFIALSGISILNGVVLVSYFNQLSFKAENCDEIVFQGALSRLRPVMMTALTDIFGFLPMMFTTGLGAEVQKPLATVVVGGMISSTLLTLIVLPTLYSLFLSKSKIAHSHIG